MVIDFLLALLLPFILMVGTTRLVFNRYGALLVTLMILIFGLHLYEKAFYFIILALLSLALGWRQSRRIVK